VTDLLCDCTAGFLCVHIFGMLPVMDTLTTLKANVDKFETEVTGGNIAKDLLDVIMADPKLIESLPAPYKARLKASIDKALALKKQNAAVRAKLNTLKGQLSVAPKAPVKPKVKTAPVVKKKAAAPAKPKSKTASPKKSSNVVSQIQGYLGKEWDIVTNKDGTQTPGVRIMHGIGLATLGLGVYKASQWILDKVSLKKDDSFIKRTLKTVGILGLLGWAATKFAPKDAAAKGSAKKTVKAPVVPISPKLKKTPPANSSLMKKTSIEYDGKAMDITFLPGGVKINTLTYAITPTDVTKGLYTSKSLLTGKNRSIKKAEIAKATWTGSTVSVDAKVHYEESPFFGGGPTSKGIDDKIGKGVKLTKNDLEIILSNGAKKNKKFSTNFLKFEAK